MTSFRRQGRFRGHRKSHAFLALVLASALALTACSSGGSDTGDSSSQSAGTLVVDTSFVMTSFDPARALTPTLSIATRGMYDTLLKTTAEDSTPEPSVAESFEASEDATTYTFHLRDDVTFSDGAKLTSADVVFSFQRLANLQLGGSYLMDGLTVSAPDDSTVVLTSEDPKPAIPAMVATPAFVILNSAQVKEAGGTDAADAPTTDTADTWFNSNSAGSGPYLLESYSADDSITLVRNDNYWGTAPKFDKVVIRNMPAATQLLNIQRGTDEIALDLSATQSETLASNDAVTVVTDPSSAVFRLQLNMDSEASAVSSNPDFQAAVRDGIDYDAMVQLAGDGAIQAPGLIPSTVPGALSESDAVTQDLDKAKEELADSGISDPSVTLSYPSGINVNGLDFATLAARVQADLQAMGITVELQGLQVSNYLSEWAKGTMEMTLTYNLPDYLDPSYYSSFVPGSSSDAVRAGWGTVTSDNQDLADLGAQINSTVDDDERAALAQELQRDLNESSPYIPLMQTAQTVVSSASLSGVKLDPIWTLDVTAVGTDN
ncbi:MAG: ABC transporter substrate-binding protein [Nocardioidaceae bacterium]